MTQTAVSTAVETPPKGRARRKLLIHRMVAIGLPILVIAIANISNNEATCPFPISGDCAYDRECRLGYSWTLKWLSHWLTHP